MPRFMVESSHEREDPSEPASVFCLRALEEAVAQGSHYLTHAEFGCEDGVHKSWIFVDAEDKEDAVGWCLPSRAPRPSSCGSGRSRRTTSGSCMRRGQTKASSWPRWFGRARASAN